MLQYHQKSDEGLNDPYHQQSPSEAAWNGYDRLTGFIIWLHSSLAIYICFFWLLPMIVIFGVSYFVDLRPLLKGKFEWWLQVSLAGVPVWLIISGYASLSDSNRARRIRVAAARFTIGFGIALLTTGAVSWLIGKP